MKVSFALSPECTVEQEVKDVKQGFQFIAYAQEVFGVKKCGNCGSPHVRLCYRTPKGYEYYSVKCHDCHHELKFGQQKETGRLFPKGWEAGFQSDDDAPQSRNGRSGPQYHNNQDDAGDYNPPPRERQAAPTSRDEIPF